MMIEIDLSKQQALDVNFTANLYRTAAMLFMTEEANEAILDFSEGTVRL